MTTAKAQVEEIKNMLDTMVKDDESHDTIAWLHRIIKRVADTDIYWRAPNTEIFDE